MISNFKSKIKAIPLLTPFYRRVRIVILEILESFVIAQFSMRSRPLNFDSSANLIVSLTSFPARIDHAWIAIESIFQQDLQPSRVVLVLSDEEFPTRELPKRIQQQVQRGLEILWTPRNIRSFKKLLPVRDRYPEATIVTVDDDILYESWRLRQLVEASKERPTTIIGHRGWVVTQGADGLSPYVSWPKASPKTASQLCFLTSGGGVLYPPNSLPSEILLNEDLAMQLCPRADDVWFWAVAQIALTPSFCLGNHQIQPIQRLRISPALSTSNCDQGGNDVQLLNTIQFFNIKVESVKIS